MWRVLAYCARSWRINTFVGLLAAGRVVKPLTCPPLTAETFDYDLLAEASLAYVALHGIPGQPYLYGDGWLTALSVAGVAEAPEMPGLIVFLEGCFGAETGMPEAFLERGAAAVVASTAETEDRTVGLGPAGRLGRDFVRGLRRGLTAGDSLARAKAKATAGTAAKFCLFGNGQAKIKYEKGDDNC